jgi:hypothetical protein
MLEIIPVYLDHILFPLMNENIFKTEIFHINGKGEEGGVSYRLLCSCVESVLLTLIPNRLSSPRCKGGKVRRTTLSLSLRNNLCTTSTTLIATRLEECYRTCVI